MQPTASIRSMAFRKPLFINFCLQKLWLQYTNLDKDVHKNYTIYTVQHVAKNNSNQTREKMINSRLKSHVNRCLMKGRSLDTFIQPRLQSYNAINPVTFTTKYQQDILSWNIMCTIDALNYNNIIMQPYTPILCFSMQFRIPAWLFNRLHTEKARLQKTWEVQPRNITFVQYCIL